MNRADLQQLAKDRIRDARALLDAKRWAGAYYLAGYAVECTVKACIARLMQPEVYPDKSFADKCWTHKLHDLIGLAGLKGDFEAALQADPDLAKNWNTVKDWNESTRYTQKAKADAEKLFEAITEKKHGVLSWFKLRW